MILRKLSEDATTLTLGWDAVPGADGFRFSRSAGQGRFSHTWDGARTSVRFSKDSDWYAVDRLVVADQGVYPPVTPPAVTLPRYGISTGANPSFAVLDQCKAIGAQYVRFDYPNALNATDVSRVNRVHTNGQHPLLILPRRNPDGMGTFVATYWKDKLPLRMYEIGNEPDRNGWTAATYAPMAKAWCDEIRAADPDALIWLPGGFKGGDVAGNTPPDYAKSVCAAGCDFDVWSGHYFDEDPAGTALTNGWRYADLVRQILDAHNRQSVVIASSESHPFNRAGDTAQADTVRTMVGYATTGKLASVAVYRMDYSETGSWDSALLNPDGSRRPAWDAYKAAVTA